MRVTDEYVFFWGGPLSQWAKTPFTYDAIPFQTAEHFMMYNKAIVLGDDDAASRVLTSHSPKVAKAIGRNVKATERELARWDEVKFDVVVEGNMHKFMKNPDLLKTLLDLYPRKFVEASPYDSIWGIGMKETHPDILDETKWQGTNLLGKALDKVAHLLHGTDV